MDVAMGTEVLPALPAQGGPYGPMDGEPQDIQLGTEGEGTETVGAGFRIDLSRAEAWAEDRGILCGAWLGVLGPWV